MLTFEKNERTWLRNLKRVMSHWNHTRDEHMGDNPFRHFVFVAKADNWSDFTQWQEALHGNWGFRGQKDHQWLLHSSLDRAARVSAESPNFSFVTHVDRGAIEDRLLFRFKQQAHRYIRHLPDDHDLVSWLALMQHHGAPTRLLDWTCGFRAM